MAQEIQFPVGHEKLDNLMVKIRERVPEVKIYVKRTSKLNWILYIVSFMWIWNRIFFSNYTTTIQWGVYLSDILVDTKDWQRVYMVMRHEFIHLLQRKKYKILHNAGYLFPQFMAAFALLAILAAFTSHLWLIALVSLLFLAPLPAPYRKKAELEGSTQSLLVYWEEYGEIPQTLIDGVIKHFTGPDYFFMWPFRSSITKEVNQIVWAIRSGEISGIYLHY